MAIEKEAQEHADDRVAKYVDGLVAGHIDQAKVFVPLVRQLCHDLNRAHDELTKAHNSDPLTCDWPEWSSQANSIRWAEGILKEKLAKTNNWTLYPDATPARDAGETP